MVEVGWECVLVRDGRGTTKVKGTHTDIYVTGQEQLPPTHSAEWKAKAKLG